MRLTGIDLTPEMLVLARDRAADLGMPVTLCEGDAQELPFPDGMFDTVLSTYSMCSVPDEGRAVLEMKRVLKNGGRLILVDHVRGGVAPIYWIQRLMELAPSRGERELYPPPDHARASRWFPGRGERSIASRNHRAVGGREAITLTGSAGQGGNYARRVAGSGRAPLATFLCRAGGVSSRSRHHYQMPP